MLVPARSDVLDRKHDSHGDTDDVVHGCNPVPARGKWRWEKSANKTMVSASGNNDRDDPQALTAYRRQPCASVEATSCTARQDYTAPETRRSCVGYHSVTRLTNE